MKTLIVVVSVFLFAHRVPAADDLPRSAQVAMERATRFFRTEVAHMGGYLWNYRSDFAVREGEVNAPASAIWVQPPGTPAVGLAMLEAYEATKNKYFLDGAIDAARALVWGQMSSGGWAATIDFDPQRAKAWHYRRDVLAGDTQKGTRKNSTMLDDNNTQSALLLLMRVDRALDFKDAPIHEATLAGLQALLDAQYPNGAWPQHFSGAPDPKKFPALRARYPDDWPRKFPAVKYSDFYTFNDGCMTDVMRTMFEAHRIYRDDRYLASARRLGDFILLAQMPDPQPVWAQQYNLQMEPAWARKFEPPSVTGGEIRDILLALLDLHTETGDKRFLAPFPSALAWLERSRLPDGRYARFYELKTNRPLFFTKDYVMTYDDSSMPTHYGFKVSGDWIPGVKASYERALGGAGKKGPAKKEPSSQQKNGSSSSEAEVRAIVAALDAKGRWLEQGRLKSAEDRTQFVPAEIISCRTFNKNLSVLARYVKSRQRP